MGLNLAWAMAYFGCGANAHHGFLGDVLLFSHLATTTTTSHAWIALAVHGGIALFLGMITFGFMMIVANLSFIEPSWIERLVKRISKAGSSE